MPITVVTFALARLDDCNLTASVVLTGFLAAGTIGVVVSAVTEIYLLPTGAGPVGNALGFFGVGLIEEVSKGAVLVAVAWRLRERTVHGGMVLGATVGAGFSAFESTGYAFYAYVQHTNDHPELNILQTEVTRAMLAPFGHLTWTALLGGALFAASARANGGFLFTPRVGWTLAGVAALHGVWDATYGWGIWITQGFTGNGWVADWPMTTRNNSPASPVAAKNSARPTTNWSSRSAVVAQPSAKPNTAPTAAASRMPSAVLPVP